MGESPDLLGISMPGSHEHNDRSFQYFNTLLNIVAMLVESYTRETAPPIAATVSGNLTSPHFYLFEAVDSIIKVCDNHIPFSERISTHGLFI